MDFMKLKEQESFFKKADSGVDLGVYNLTKLSLRGHLDQSLKEKSKR